jgi:hypothetical protein
VAALRAAPSVAKFTGRRRRGEFVIFGMRVALALVKLEFAGSQRGPTAVQGNGGRQECLPHGFRRLATQNGIWRLTGMGPMALVCCVGGLQLLGLASTALARVSEGSRAEIPTRGVFVVLLVAVAVIALGAVSSGSAWWPACGLTFGLMVVGATIESRHSQRYEF